MTIIALEKGLMFKRSEYINTSPTLVLGHNWQFTTKQLTMSYYLPQRVVTGLLNRFMPSESIDSFNKWLSRGLGMVAGSATTWMVAQSHKSGESFLRQPPQWEPKDLDIWLCEGDDCGSYISDDILEWFHSQQFLVVDRGSGSHKDRATEYMGVWRNDFSVTSMCHNSRKYGTIQIMILKAIDPLVFLSEHFDLSVVLNFWNGRVLYSAWIELTRENKMARCNFPQDFPNASTLRKGIWNRREERLRKYQSRGFQLMSENVVDRGAFHKIHIVAEHGNDLPSNPNSYEEQVCSRISGLHITSPSL